MGVTLILDFDCPINIKLALASFLLHVSVLDTIVIFSSFFSKQKDFIKSLKKNTKIKRFSSTLAQTPSENQHQRMARNKSQWEHPTPTQKAPQPNNHKYH